MAFGEQWMGAPAHHSLSNQMLMTRANRTPPTAGSAVPTFAFSDIVYSSFTLPGRQF